MTWKDSTMVDAIRHAGGRIVNPEWLKPNLREGLPFDFDVVTFTDGTAVACRSDWSGPYSEVTPDIDANAPVWKILS